MFQNAMPGAVDERQVQLDLAAESKICGVAKSTQEAWPFTSGGCCQR